MPIFNVFYFIFLSHCLAFRYERLSDFLQDSLFVCITVHAYKEIKYAVILYSNNTVKYCFETFLVVAVSPASNGDFCMGCRNIFRCVTQGHIISVAL